ncbi:MAG TPA: DUF3311 domain-containing protein [Candidatus Binataceae bacterium]|nr:DUF3311 domain-containing protein [Candidatus Binataceae bacterium]
MSTEQKKRGGWSWWYSLFALEYLVLLWPALYNRVKPTLFGIPFFYWFQLVCVVVGALVTTVVYLACRE